MCQIFLNNWSEYMYKLLEVGEGQRGLLSMLKGNIGKPVAKQKGRNYRGEAAGSSSTPERRNF